MQVHQDVDARLYAIKSHDGKQVIVQVPQLADQITTDTQSKTSRYAEITLSCSFIISARSLDQNWRPQSLEQLTEADIEGLLTFKPEVVIIGTGEKLVWPPRNLMAPLINAGIGYEIMNTAAACRTYNVLSYEGRDVVAALII